MSVKWAHSDNYQVEMIYCNLFNHQCIADGHQSGYTRIVEHSSSLIVKLLYCQHRPHITVKGIMPWHQVVRFMCQDMTWSHHPGPIMNCSVYCLYDLSITVGSNGVLLSLTFCLIFSWAFFWLRIMVTNSIILFLVKVYKMTIYKQLKFDE